MPVYVAREKWVPDSAQKQGGTWTRAEIDSFTVSYLPVATRAEADLVSCDPSGRCKSLVAAVVIRIAEPSVTSNGSRVRLIYTYPLRGDLSRTESTKALFSLERSEGAWVVVEAVYSDP